jgi:hypothetical protein
MSNKKEKSTYQKIRKTWEIKPTERIKEDKKSTSNICDDCGDYLVNPEACITCQLGGA